MSTVGKCLDVICLLLDLNFLIVHTVVRTVLAAVAFVNSLPSLLLNLLMEGVKLVVFCFMSVVEATCSVAHGTVSMLGSTVLALEGLLESLKMVGYLSMHYVLRGKDQLCRGVLWLLEGCGIAVSLFVYLVNTVVNFTLIATQNIYASLASVLQTVSGPLQKALELTLTSFTFLYSSLVWTSAFLWSPCKLVLDFTLSLVQMFISIFILNIYGLLLTVIIAFTTTAYLNPELTHQAARRLLDYVRSFPALRTLYRAHHRLAAALCSSRHFLRVALRRLSRICHHLYVLERGLWQQVSRLSSQLTLALRTQLHRDGRVRGDGDPGDQRRDPPDGRAGDGAQQEQLDLEIPSSSTDRPLRKLSSPEKDGKSDPAENLLTLLKEQEERKKCVICQDSVKTVVLLPCRHLCLCTDCKNILLNQPIYQQNCPLCRHMILNTMDVYL